MGAREASEQSRQVMTGQAAGGRDDGAKRFAMDCVWCPRERNLVDQGFIGFFLSNWTEWPFFRDVEHQREQDW